MHQGMWTYIVTIPIAYKVEKVNMEQLKEATSIQKRKGKGKEKKKF